MAGNAISFVLAAALGYVLLRRRIGPLGLRRVFATLGRLGLAGLIAAVPTVLVVIGLTALWGDEQGGERRPARSSAALVLVAAYVGGRLRAAGPRGPGARLTMVALPTGPVTGQLVSDRLPWIHIVTRMGAGRDGREQGTLNVQTGSLCGHRLSRVTLRSTDTLLTARHVCTSARFTVWDSDGAIACAAWVVSASGTGSAPVRGSPTRRTGEPRRRSASGPHPAGRRVFPA